MACDSQAGLEAQKLISISLGKMAASRVGRTGASLHKSLLVASVLHRARHVFLEESYHVHRVAHPEACPQPPSALPAAAPPVVAVYTPLLPPPPPTTAEDTVDSEDKENQTREPAPQQEQPAGDVVRMPLSENNNVNNTRQTTALKRRRVSQQETQEAVWSILPKRPRTCPTPEPSEEQEDSDSDDNDVNNSMEVEHITSLVSIFSFGGQRVDMCGTEAAREDLAQFQPVALAV